MASIKFEFSDTSIAALTPEPKRRMYFDSLAPGFAVEVHPSGKRTFLFYRRVGGQPVKKVMNESRVSAARSRAREWLGDIERWERLGRVTPSPWADDPTKIKFSEVLERYLADHLRKQALTPERADRAEKRARELYNRGLAALGSRRISSIRRSELLAIHTNIAQTGKVQANRVIELYRRVARWGAAEGIHNSPDVLEGFEYTREFSRKRYITVEEQPRFFQTLKREPNRSLRDFVGVLVFTGARKNAVLAMRWCDIDGNLWHIPADASKNGEPYSAPLEPVVLKILAGRKRLTGDSPWVFPSSTRKGEHLRDLKKPWSAFKTRANLGDVHLHDLRRTFSTMTLAAGASLFLTGKALGHKNEASTRPYAQPEIDAIRAAVKGGVALMEANAKKKSPPLLTAKNPTS